MSGLICVLASAIIAAGLMGPPALPPEAEASSDPPASTDAPPTNPNPDAPPNPDHPPPPEPPRTSLPPGLEPVPFPLEQQRRSEVTPPPTQESGGDTLTPVTPPPERRSIVDLRDPFDRPPPTRTRSERTTATRLIMPDLKDPFAPGLRRVRSKRLDMYVPNDIRDPFRERPPGEGPRSTCARTTEDGTIVQSPGAQAQCPPSPIDLRDPFTAGQTK